MKQSSNEAAKQRYRTLPNGSLLKIGNYGNKGGGRRAVAVRSKCRRSFLDSLEALVKISKGEAIERGANAPNYSEMIRAGVALGRFGLAVTDQVVAQDLLEAICPVLADHLPSDRVEAAMDAIFANLSEPSPNP